MGTAAIMAGSIRGFSSMRAASMRVRMGPGQTALTRIPRVAYSRAAVRVRPTTPCLEAT